MKLFDKKLWLFGGGFAVFWWFVFGQWNSIVGPWLGIFGQFAQIAVMAIFVVVFVMIYRKVFKQTV